VIKYKVRTICGERTLTSGQAIDYMQAHRIAEQSARELGFPVYLWYGDRAPVRIG
jgi:hypothetical protein